jgi:hypothetical protein
MDILDLSPSSNFSLESSQDSQVISAFTSSSSDIFDLASSSNMPFKNNKSKLAANYLGSFILFLFC